ncbi:MAG TPA: phosphoribosylformylglycinamidine cyclo-ligase [Acidimicrobiales bacterium]|nr:phosphoribosylformylglycinamidine cyclo-ligase [Acidimicrobiales bacterium]
MGDRAGDTARGRITPNTALTYASSGVDIDAADAAVDAIRDLVASTADQPGVIGGIGGFGGLFEVPSGYRRPVLVSSTDGVGTKLTVAMATGRFDTIGLDLVAMVVDDLVCSGARPLFFLNYQLLGRVDPEQVRQVMRGMAEGCRQAGCAIVGGELAEHPGLIRPGEIDIAGFAVGVVERDEIVDGPARTREGDVLVGLPSPGLRSNGYSLARKALLERAGRSLSDPAWAGAGSWTLADELLRPSVIYTPAILRLIGCVPVHAIAHITGGGLPGNVPRVLSPALDALFEHDRWETPRIFGEIQAAGGVSDEEMARVFNLGLGMVVAVGTGDEEAAVAALSESGVDARVVGRLVAGSGSVHIR